MTKVFTVRLVRPVFQSVTIEVQALNSSSAASKALRRATALSDSDWTNQNSGDEDYTLHVQSVLDHQIVYETSANPHQEIRSFRQGVDTSDPVRYLILSADLNARVGQVLPQPWFTRTEPILQADLCTDWIEPINFILENDGLDDDGEPAGMSSESCHNDNVIEFPSGDLDQELVEVKS